MNGEAPVALDAMGGDHAPLATVAGALAARDAGIAVVLVGQAELLRVALAEAGAPGALEIVDAADSVEMGEDPALALRAKPRASVRVAVDLVAAGRAAAVLSMGSTGATLAAALLTLGRAGGLRRPAVAARLPVAGGTCVLIDAGASPDAQAETLVAYARMGSAYAEVLRQQGRGPAGGRTAHVGGGSSSGEVLRQQGRGPAGGRTAHDGGGSSSGEVLGAQAPRLGLLNVGTEVGKGSALAREAHGLLAALPGFVGNVEPAAVLDGAVDVLVTDGFTGNVFLKTIEALGRRAGGAGDSAAVLLGVAGTVLVGHGDADAGAVAGALAHARECADAALADRVAERLLAVAR